ncbi:hypothetical protein [Aquabacterium sp. CECT 9606]|uniref:hypothetical protein n=1 Tax=Aquabacterium sp. CECT 9606 TaxID=2845822 RepID=UPI001E406489|nr:hypothetical protein [Aquabacterium sp. CECT 9606]
MRKFGLSKSNLFSHLKKIAFSPMLTPKKCLREEEFLPAVRVGGIKDCRISFDPQDKTFNISVEVRSTGEVFFLATRRIPDSPRKFKSVDVAINTATKLLGVTKFTVLTH